MTDDARNHTTSRAFAESIADLGARHPATRPSRPPDHGKAERPDRTLLDEWACARPFTSDDQRLADLPAWLDHHDHHRPHSALAGLAPMQALVNNVSGNHT